MKKLIKDILRFLHVDINQFIESVARWSLLLSVKENHFSSLMERLRAIVPDISQQQSAESLVFSPYVELKRRVLQTFQCQMMLKVVEMLNQKHLTVVDIGDSAGTHMLYLKELVKDKCSVDTLSVNLDPRAIEKIKKRGLPAILKRAEEIDLNDMTVDLFTSFEMVEHLHDPATFLHRLAKSENGKYLLLTVPYLHQSRVGFHHLRRHMSGPVHAEEVHVFELSPEDWKLLMKHSGWKVVYERIYYQYPRRLPIINLILRIFWKNTDFEGFWGVILEKDLSYSSQYQDWN